jgi:hypothetical protein
VLGHSWLMGLGDCHTELSHSWSRS